MADWMRAVENWWQRETMRSSWENRWIGVDGSYLIENERMTRQREEECRDLVALNVISKGFVESTEHG